MCARRVGGRGRYESEVSGGGGGGRCGGVIVVKVQTGRGLLR